MKRIVSIIILISMTFLVSSCSFSDKENIIKYDLSEEPKNLDPQTASDKASLMVINSVFEGLFYINEYGEVKNGLAKNMSTSQDGLTYTIDLIDALWENGESVTAKDFVFTFQRLVSKETNSPGASQFLCIKNAKEINNGEKDKSTLGVTALSDKKLQIELEYHNDNFVNLLATTYAMPCNEEFFYETKGKYGLQAKHTMTNGAFTVYSWKHEEYIRIKKNKNYYDKENVIPSGVNFYVPSEETTTLERLLDKDINASFIYGNDINYFNNKGYNTEPIEDTTWGLYLNTKNKSLSDINIRKAISECFNRSSYSDKLKSNLSVAKSIIPHSIMLYDKTYRDYAGENIVPEFDAEKAYEYYKTGLTTLKKQNIQALKLLINKDENLDAVNYFSYPSQIFQKELGLFINIEEVEQVEYNKRILSGDFDIALYKLSSSDNTVNSIFERFESDSNKNYISYSNLIYDNLSKETISQTKKSTSGYITLEKIIIEDAVFIPMFYATNYFVLTDETKGIVYNKTTGLINFKNAIVN